MIRTSLSILAMCAVWLSALSHDAAADEPPFAYDWPSFHCRSEFPLEQPRALGDDLENLRLTLADTCGLELAAMPVDLYLFNSRRRYIAEVGELTSAARRQRGVYVQRDQRPAVYSFRQQDLDSILRHESVHALLHGSLDYVPLWLDEGLASYFEVPVDSRADGHTFQRRVKWNIQFGWRPDLSALEGKRQSEDLNRGDYCEAWAWVHFLLHESDESHAALTSYLQGIAAGAPPQPFSRHLASKLPQAQERFVRHFKTWAE